MIQANIGIRKRFFFSKENDIVNELALSNVLRLKFRMVQKMMEENLQKIKEAETGGSWEQLDQALIDQTGLKDAERELAKMLRSEERRVGKEC